MARPYRFADGTSPVLYTPKMEPVGSSGYLRVVDENAAAEVAALIRELHAYQQHGNEARAELVREQLRLRGAIAPSPETREESPDGRT